MHFWNKLSTAALMRLTILASFNLLLVRLVGHWEVLLHPWFFLSLVTLNLGLYAVMVYSGSLNTTLIGMMLSGLVVLLGVLAYTGMDASTFFQFKGPYRDIGKWVEGLMNRAFDAMPARVQPGRPLRFNSLTVLRLGHAVVDAVGLIAILAGGWLARWLRGGNRGQAT